MDLNALRLATDLGGHLLSGPTPAHALILVERSQAHGLPGLLVVGSTPEDLEVPLAAMVSAQALLNLTAILPARESCLPLALAFHCLRIGSLVGAVDAGLPWLGDRPMMVKRLPGRLRAPQPIPLDPASLRPLERADLLIQLGSANGDALTDTFLLPPWSPGDGAFLAPWWPGVPKPREAELLVPHLTLPSHTPFTEALRTALRVGSAHPVPWLPHPGDPSILAALSLLTPEIAAFRGSMAAWTEAFKRLAALPAPPHFCARC